MATTTRNVVITFVDDEDKERRVTVRGARSGLTQEEIKPLAEALVANTAALKNTLVKAKKAAIVSTTTTNIKVSDE